jgi:hypothetical protein
LLTNGDAPLITSSRPTPRGSPGREPSCGPGGGGAGVGSDYKLVCRDAEGRQHAVYLGPAGPLVDETRQALDRLQAPLRERRRIQAARQALRWELAKSRTELDAELVKVGLYRKGSEIRGWAGAGAAGRAPTAESPARSTISRVTIASASRTVFETQE